MRYVYIEPSVWVKHYIAEPGTDVANDLFAQLLPQQRALLCSRLGLPEVVSVINRRRNAGHLNQAAFNVLYHQFEADRRASGCFQFATTKSLPRSVCCSHIT
jgi:predicted nucleic acid-binding protein